jgi:hypothetical protein
MQLKLGDLFGAHQLRGLMEVAGELLYGQDVASNRFPAESRSIAAG